MDGQQIDQPKSKPTTLLVRVGDELGLVAIYKSPLDTKLLCIQRFVRLFAYGASTLVLALYLSDLGNSEGKIGLFMTLTLVGDVIVSFILTIFADGLGRKAVLALGAAMMTASGIAFGLSGNYYVLLAAAIFGVISPRYGSRSAVLLYEILIVYYSVVTRLDLSVPSKSQLWLISLLPRAAPTYLRGTRL